jgi:hypothetical protein
MYNRMKTCKVCGVSKPLDNFFKQPSNKEGLALKCKPCQYEYNKRYNYSESKKQYYQSNKSKLKAQIMAWNKTKRESDPIFKFSGGVRVLIRESFKRACSGVHVKSTKTQSILGCSMDEFIIYIQSKFQPGMTLENHGAGAGKWNIDHTIPISSAQCEGDIIKLNHYTNLQPLWFEDNMAKGNKLTR